MNVQTVQGEEIGKLRLGKFFRKIGDAFKKGASAVFKGLAKLNPVLIPARAAFLTMVRNNTGGVARKMQRKGIEKARRQWENLGGDFAKLQAAVKAGAGQPIKGIGAITTIDPELAAMLAEMRRAAGLPMQGVGAAPAFGAILEAAKPILEKILGILGIKLGEPEPGEAPPTTAEQELARAMENLPPNPITERITDAARDPGLPQPSGGGSGGGLPSWVPWAFGGVALGALALSSRRNR